MKVGNSIAALPPDVRKASGFPVRPFFVPGGYASGLREAEPRARSFEEYGPVRQSLTAHQTAEPRTICWTSLHRRIIRRECRKPDTRRGQHQADDRLGVFDLAISDHLQSALDRQADDFDQFIIFQALRSRSKIG